MPSPTAHEPMWTRLVGIVRNMWSNTGTHTIQDIQQAEAEVVCWTHDCFRESTYAGRFASGVCFEQIVDCLANRWKPDVAPLKGHLQSTFSPQDKETANRKR